MKKKSMEMYKSKDKKVVPFLLTQNEIQFVGTEADGPIIYFKFTPFDKCQKLVNNFESRKAPLVQPKDLLDAVETFKNRVFEMKDGRFRNET